MMEYGVGESQAPLLQLLYALKQTSGDNWSLLAAQFGGKMLNIKINYISYTDSFLNAIPGRNSAQY